MAADPFWIFLNRWLREHNWSQVRLADAAGVHETVVGRWLHADERRRARPGRHTLPRLAEVLDVPVQDLVVMIFADQARSPQPEGVGRTRLVARLQAVQEQYERWIAAVGPENEEYFWRYLKNQGDSTVDLIRGLGTAVSAPADTAVSGVVSAPIDGANGLADDAGRGLTPDYRLSHTRLAAPRGSTNGVLAA